MPLDSFHPSYQYQASCFRDCRNAFEGSRVIKASGTTYLPLLKGQEASEYAAYKERAVFFGVTQKTVSALVGLALLRDPVIKAVPDLDYYFKDRQGAQFFEVCSMTLQEVILMGGNGLLIDAGVDGGQPQIRQYPRDSVINWRVDYDTGEPLMVVLQEQIYLNKGSDEYLMDPFLQYRKLYIGNDGFYHVRVHDDKHEVVGDVIPLVKGQPLTKIPFYMITSLGVGMNVVRPPMLDIVDLNISLYRTSADLEHGRHFTGLPTPVISGMEASEMRIGSSTAWVLPNPDAKAYYLEFTGQGLGALEKATTEKLSQMASMSARLIDNSKRGSESEGTVKLRYMSETASLTTIVRSVEDGLNQVYGLLAEFQDLERPTIKLNKQFSDAQMSAAELLALVKAYTDGTISQETFLYNMRKADKISPHQDDAVEKSKMIAEGGPPETIRVTAQAGIDANGNIIPATQAPPAPKTVAAKA